MQEEIYSRLNRVPDKNLGAFLEMLGINPLPSKPSRVPITFYSVAGFPEGIYIPEGTPLASPQTEDHAVLSFETSSNFSACDTSITNIFSVDPSEDFICDHLSDLQSGKPFKPFEGENLQRHFLYLGHSTLFKMEGSSSVTLRFIFANSVMLDDLQRLIWEYCDQSGKTVAITSIEIEFPNGPEGGPSDVVDITLTPSSKINQMEVNGNECLWIICRPDDIYSLSSLPVIERIAVVKIRSKKAGSDTVAVNPDYAFCNFTPIDLTASELYPLGRQPRLFDSFYLASREIQSKKGASITITFSGIAGYDAKPQDVKLIWEYLDGMAWKVLNVSTKDFTDNNKFTDKFNGSLKFTCPSDLREGEVYGISNYWIRCTLIQGDYGREKMIENPDDKTWSLSTSHIKPPWISSVKFILDANYGEGTPLEGCLSYNNFGIYKSHKQERRRPRLQVFHPPSENPSLHSTSGSTIPSVEET